MQRAGITLGDFLNIPTPNTGQLNPLFHTVAEFRLIVNRIVARHSTDWLAANAQFSPNDRGYPNLDWGYPNPWTGTPHPGIGYPSPSKAVMGVPPPPACGQTNKVKLLTSPILRMRVVIRLKTGLREVTS